MIGCGVGAGSSIEQPESKIYPSMYKYMLAPQGVGVGDAVSSMEDAPIKPGMTLMLSSIPAGTSIHNIELRPGKGGQMCRSAGTSAALIKNETDGYSVLRLPSGATHLMSVKVVSMYVSVLFAGNFLE